MYWYNRVIRLVWIHIRPGLSFCKGIIKYFSYMPEYVFSIARAGQENLCQEIVPSYAHVI